MKKLLANLSLTQRITIAIVAVVVVAGIYSLVHWQKEQDFKPLFTGVSPEDGAAIIQKLRESGVEYRLPEGGGSVLVPSARLAELRLNMELRTRPGGRVGAVGDVARRRGAGARPFDVRERFGLPRGPAAR
jgi:flagellar M-ring protein FliF